MTGNPCNDWIGAGFANDLVTSIKEIPGIKVIEEAEMGKLIDGIKFGMSGFVDDKTAMEKGKFIGAHYCVVGGVQLFENKAVICYRLVNMQTGEVVFSNTVRGRLKNILELEDTVSEQVVKHFENKFPAVLLKSSPKKMSSFTIVHGDGSQGLKYSLIADLEESRKCYEAAILENPEFADGYMGLGDICMHDKKYVDAVGMFCKAYNLYVTYNDNYFSGTFAYKIGEAYYQQSDFDSAVTYFNKALQYKRGAKKDAQVVRIYERLADIADAHNESAKFVSYIKRAIKVSATLKDTTAQSDLLSKLANYFASVNDYISAIEYSKMACELPTENGERISFAEIEKDYIIRALKKSAAYMRKPPGSSVWTAVFWERR